MSDVSSALVGFTTFISRNGQPLADVLIIEVKSNLLTRLPVTNADRIDGKTPQGHFGLLD